MPKEVQNFLSHHVREGREAKTAKPSLHYDKDARTQRKKAKGELALKLGHGHKTDDKGTTGTLLIKDINGKYVGVFKVDTYDPHMPTTLLVTNWLKANFGGQLTYLSQGTLAQPRSEVATDVLDKILGLNMVPSSMETMLLTPGGIEKEGVFQVFITRNKSDQGILADTKQAIDFIANHQETMEPKEEAGFTLNNPNWDENKFVEFKDVMEFWNNKKEYTPEEITLFQKFAAFDFLIGNLDRHEENWFVTLSKDGVITNIKAIDNANAFPIGEPALDSTAARSRYKWRNLNIANQPFTEETKKFIRTNLKPEKIEEYLNAISQKKGLESFLNDQMKEGVRKRAAILLSNSFEPSSPREVALISQISQEQY